MDPDWTCYKTGTGCVAKDNGNPIEVEEGNTIHIIIPYSEYNHIMNKLGRRGLKDYIECAGGDFEKHFDVEVFEKDRQVEIHQVLEEEY